MIFLSDPFVEKDSEFKGIEANLFFDFMSGENRFLPSRRAKNPALGRVVSLITFELLNNT